MTSTTPPNSGQDNFDTIAPAEVRLASAAPAEPTVAASRTPGIPPGAWIALAVLLLLAAAVFLLLPAAVEERRASAPDSAAISADAGAAPEAAPAAPAPAASALAADATDADTVPPFETMRLERERRAAQEILERMVALVDELEARAVDTWGSAGMQAARATAEAGDTEFLAQRYPAALANYEAAVTELQQLADAGDALIETRINDGLAALEAGDSAAAIEAFDLVLRMDPEEPRALRGAERAAVVEQITDLLQQARDIALDGAVGAARSLVTEALGLDADNTAARALAEELDLRLGTAAFQADMSRGYAALGDGRFDDATAAFDSARARSADAPEVAEAFRILAAEQLAARIEEQRSAAEAAEAESRWAVAAAAYTDALALDATLAFARSGLIRSQRRADLDAAITAVLEAPETLNETRALTAARGLLARAQDVPAPDARLTQQISALTEVLRLAVIPVPIQFTSDGYTRVRLLRVSDLGSFSTLGMELVPGRYVATGVRIGFQDARVEFIVTPQGTETPIRIACTTRI